MLSLFMYTFVHFGDLSSTSGIFGIVLPSLVPTAAVFGFFIAARLSRRDTAGFARMGQNN